MTIAKYLTPNGTDIHKNGIEPDIEAEIPGKELEDFKVEYLGTNKDSQYKVAEKALLKSLKLSELTVDENAKDPETGSDNQYDQQVL